MRVIDATVDWKHDYSNSPQLVIDVDAMPFLASLRFTKRPYGDHGHVYYAESDGYVRFFHYSGAGDGYGGALFRLTMQDGSEEILVGPSSGNSLIANALGFGPCLEATLQVGKGRYAAAITLAAAKPIVASLGVYLVKDNIGAIVPSVHPFELHKPTSALPRAKVTA